jgi:hypothetical protein
MVLQINLRREGRVLYPSKVVIKRKTQCRAQSMLGTVRALLTVDGFLGRRVVVPQGTKAKRQKSLPRSFSPLFTHAGLYAMQCSMYNNNKNNSPDPMCMCCTFDHFA